MTPRLDSILRRAVWVGLAAVVLLSPTQYGVEVARRTYVSVVDPLVWVVFGLWLLAAWRAPAPRHVRLPPLLVWVFLALAALSATRAIHPARSAKDIFQFVEYFGVAYVLFASAPDRARARRLADLVLVAATAVVALGAAQYLRPGVADFAVRATFGNRNVLGGYLAIVAPLMAGVALYAETWWRRAWLGVVVAAALLITLSGGALLAMALALAVVALARGRAAFLAVAAALCVVLSLALPRLPRHNDAALAASWQLYDDNNAVALRYTEWQAASVMIAENPWLGVGIGNYQDNIGGYFGVLPRPTGVVEHDSENLYLVVAASTGLPGLAAFVGLLLTFGLRAARGFAAARDRGDKGLCLGVLGATFGFAVCAIWHPLLVRGVAIQLAILGGLLAALDGSFVVEKRSGVCEGETGVQP